MKPILRMEHPRLFIDETGFERIRRNAATVQGRRLYARVKRDADHILTTSPEPITVRDGRRMGDCHLSRWNIFSSLFAYIVESDRRYADRAIAEMMSIAAMPNWNPSHYLDVSESCTQLAIGYDWLYDLLTEDQRLQISFALRNNAVEEAFRKEHEWINGYNNWVQICNAGMVLAALAIAEDAPEWLEKTVNRAVEGVSRIMIKSYSPCGTYPESPGYWGYGTLFNLYLIEALEGCFGTSFGLSEIPGWSETGKYEAAMICPDGGLYSYSDSGVEFSAFTPYLYMLNKFHQPELYTRPFAIAYEKCLNRTDFAKNKEDSDLPMALFWIDALPDQPGEPTLNYNSTNGSLSPITVHRSGGGADAAYLACRGGSAANSHGHMDAGSFFYMADAVRWAQDFGGPRYTLEQKVDLWNLSQSSQRWRVFKVGIHAHNILTFDDRDQSIAGRVTIAKYDPEHQITVMDMHDPYVDSAKSVLRACKLTGKTATIYDTVRGARPGAVVKWQLQTDAAIELSGPLAELSKDGKKLAVSALDGADFMVVDPAQEIEPWDDPPPPEWKTLVLEYTVPESGNLDIKVELTPLE